MSVRYEAQLMFTVKHTNAELQNGKEKQGALAWRGEERVGRWTSQGASPAYCARYNSARAMLLPTGRNFYYTSNLLNAAKAK